MRQLFIPCRALRVRFFFSSRRRHTRWPRDWSSDVCSSDLVVLSGHYHHVMSGGIAGIPVHVVPGITNVVDVVAAGGKERSLALSGAGIVELGQGAPRVLTSVYPNAGDTLADPQAPVYEFGPEQVAAIIESAGR